MSAAFLIFPHQLFEENLTLQDNYTFVLIEDPLYFNQFKFHKQKLIMHRAAMQYYTSLLIKNNRPHLYIPFYEAKSMDDVINIINDRQLHQLHFRDVSDDWLNRRISKSAKKFGMKITHLPSPSFLCDDEFIKAHFGKKEHLSMGTFYITQRKRLDILVNPAHEPLGGKWNFDEDNRKKLPAKFVVPSIHKPEPNKFVQDAKDYVALHFANNYGSDSHFNYAVTHEDARKCLDDFLQQRFFYFGAYEDAISTTHVHLFHSVLTPYLNTGLLTPIEVVNAALPFIQEVPINSMEGFIRQIIGWREFMHAAYILKGRKTRTSNFFQHSRKIPESFYTGTTGIDPIDHTILTLNKNAYTHHIERLMVLGNFMLLCGFDPNEIYKWFMEMYIDAYDWVMVPNVYSMSQYACGGTITTKPYISGSNYILKMSEYKKGSWCDIWDALYWRFIDLHKDFFSKNPRWSFMTKKVEKMDINKLEAYYTKAEGFLETL